VTMDRAAFEAFFVATRGPLLAYLVRRVPTEDAADLLAEAYLTTWRRRTDLPPGDEGRLWLFGVARRLVLDHHRATPTGTDETATTTVGKPHQTEDRAAIWRRERAIADALGSLAPLDRELVTLTTWERLSTADAARLLGITPGTARVRLHRARARLARHPRLAQLVEDADPPDAPARRQWSLMTPTRG